MSGHFPARFFAHGGKLILWHGLADPSIPSLGTVAYYQALVKQMGGLSITQQFVRLFLFPGVFHCGNGYGPYHFDLVSAITTKGSLSQRRGCSGFPFMISVSPDLPLSSGYMSLMH